MLSIIAFIIGGYKHPNAARLWASLTAMVAGVELDEQIPEHSHWPDYGPTYTIAIEPTLVKDANKNTYIEECIREIKGKHNIVKTCAHERTKHGKHSFNHRTFM